MKIELTQNIADVIHDCARTRANDPTMDFCDKCPLSGACLEVFTGDESENK